MTVCCQQGKPQVRVQLLPSGMGFTWWLHGKSHAPAQAAPGHQAEEPPAAGQGAAEETTEERGHVGRAGQGVAAPRDWSGAGLDQAGVVPPAARRAGAAWVPCLRLRGEAGAPEGT